ncbi:hypothetical protein [uncultured Phycicoccus sp.]|uniref:hypothetical protein n=1 Tax=uncultured Phycicoccus sp. TaxID=661422 RepID=UPI0026259808|nr:hypothetical protein [uncultured Phycicoccus sp.]
MTTSAPDLITTLTTGWADAVQQWSDQSQAMWEQWGVAPWAPPAGPRPSGRRAGGSRPRHRPGHEHHPGHERHDHGCECETDVCACCVPDADIVLHARAGERRVIPFVLHNRWRRDREVGVEVGPWHRCSGAELNIQAEVDGEGFTLGPCEDRVVRLLLTVASADEADEAAEAEEKGEPPVRFADVGQCSSAYADVRFEGCARPQRVAVVVEPAACNAVEVGCDCGCC